ncbi:MAG: FAD-dependent oxidoreductase [Thermoguttaceae bacterium]|nr:FAD-dependent oxidoreductase [Thermoguttaceae bacterium]
MQSKYDVVVIGSGLGGLTTANVLARNGRSVLLVEQHRQLGGLATWFRRPKGHIFDVSLHGFPVGMIKSCRRFWNAEIADSIVQLRHIRFDNPDFSLETTFDRVDFTRILTERFGIAQATIDDFFNMARSMTAQNDGHLTTRELFERFFPGRTDVVRLLMEPITYANGSTLDDPALTYGIVFSNFMSKGVYTFEGGTDRLIAMMEAELRKNGVEIVTSTDATRIEVEHGRVSGVTFADSALPGCGHSPLAGQTVVCRAVVSNGNLLSTILEMVDAKYWDREFLEQAKAVRINNSSTQVYIGFRPEYLADESNGDLLFTSVAPEFDAKLLLSRQITSRTFSFYYPKTRPQLAPRCSVVASTNANFCDWSTLTPEAYEASKRELIEETIAHLEKYISDAREQIDWTEAATPRTFARYTKHRGGASFGTKYEGLAISRALPEQIPGLYHAGSVGIIMSGWLGAVNYGVIVANDVDAVL